MSTADNRQGSAIAIVGRACRYPGARTPAELWENVLAGRKSFRAIPPERISLADYHGEGVDSFYIREAAVLEDWEFDRVAFRVAGDSHRSADHAHWLALETAARALADSGYGDGGPDSGLPRETTGALVGNSLTGEFSRAGQMRLRWPYVRRTVAEALGREGWDGERVAQFLGGLEGTYKAPFPEPGEESLAGGLANTIAGRIANHFDLHGGGYTVDGACASSLLAVANACTALAVGDLDVALAGGVDLSLDPFELVGFARTGAFARDSMRVFDRRSAGFLPGEGCGFVVLMRLEDAISDGRRVHAVIRGWGISSDGAGGLTRPDAQGQAVAIERAYRRAGFDPASVPLFEGHGTGTAVGDPAELGALTLARRRGDRAAAERQPAAVGSVKALIGHTKAAAGVAGLLKATLALEAGVLPATVGCEEPHPLLTDGDDDGPPVLRALSRAEAWPKGAPLRAGVSAMGFGGINAHLALERAEGARPRSARRALSGWTRMNDTGRQDQELLVLAAPDVAALAESARSLAERVRPLSIAELGDLAAELATSGVSAGPARAAVVAATPRQAVERLEELAEHLDDGISEPLLGEGLFAAVSSRVPRIGFLFPGQAAPARLGGGVWARRFEEAETVYRLADLPADGTSDGVATEIAQPAIVAASVAGLAVAERLGLSARVGLGHSLGEISALAWGGALSDESALALARARGEAMASLASEGACKGGMVSLGCSAARAAELCRGTGAVVAGHNAPDQTAVSGPDDALAEVVQRAQGADLRATRLRVSHAFHSPAMAPAEKSLREAALSALATSPAEERLRGAGRRAVSTVTGEPMESLDPADDQEIVERLVDQLTGPVRFLEALRAADLEAGGVDLWVEVGPGRILSGLVADCGVAGAAVALDVGARDLDGLLSTVGAAFALGAPLALADLFRGRFVRPLAERSSFLANPCESAPVLPVPLAEAHRFELPAVAAPSSPPVPAAATPELRDLPPFEVVRSLVAARAELPEDAVRRDDRLLSDLHLNSISVGELVVSAARALGAPPPASPTDFADASVAEVAEALAALAASSTAATDEGLTPESDRDDDRLPLGVAGWVRPFVTDWRDAAPPVPADGAPRESPDILAAPSDALASAVAERLGTQVGDRPFAGAGSRRDVVVFLPNPVDGLVETVSLESVRLLLAAGQEVLGQRDRRLVLVTRGAGAGFVRSLHLERPGGECLVLEIPAADDPVLADHLAAEVLAPVGVFGPAGYREVRYDLADASWRAREPVLQVAPEDPGTGDMPLGPDDVVLVSGGGRGIAAECALELARKTGASLALLGRSAPESNDELAANLERFEASGVRFRYLVADVTDGDAVAAAVASAEKALGPVTGLLHGAGRNQPTLVAGLDEAAVAATLAPKVDGLAHLLAAVEPGRLRLLVTFGSIIGRAGLVGEADYALANELLARTAERFRARHPEARVLDAAWSVWSGVGMGERLGRLEHLLRDGITPIPPDQGIAALLSLVARDDLPASVVVAGRFGEPPTVTVPRPELPLGRFLERPRVHLAGVELVVDAELSTDTDPYLDEHVFAGERLFPAVLGLEAMAQAARALLAPDAATPPELVFEDVAFERPIAVPTGERVTLRTAVLATGSNRVQAVLRSSGTAFSVDHFRAVCRLAAASGEPDAGDPTATEAADRLPLTPTEDLYDGGVLFHQGRFRRLGGYRHLSATESMAELVAAADRPTGWFARHLPSGLLLGDPAARDAVIHSIQASIPHATVLPTGVERIVVSALGGPAAALPLTVAGRERSRDGRDLVWDVEVHDASGRVVERWEGLALRAVADQAPTGAWPVPLVAPFLERRFAELASGARLAVAVDGSGSPADGQADDHAARRARSDRLVSRLLGASVVLFRRPDGRPETSSGREVSVAHAGSLTLAVAGPAPVGCDAEPVVARPAGRWADLLGRERFRLAGELASQLGSGLDEAATRVWAAGEAIKKMGLAVDVPLTQGTAPTVPTPEGWTLLRSGDVHVGVVVVTLAAGPVAFALAALPAEADRSGLVQVDPPVDSRASARQERSA